MRLTTLMLFTVLMLCACGSKPQPDYSTPEKALATMLRAAEDDDSKAYADCFVKAEQAGMLEVKLDGSPYDEVKAGPVKEHGGYTVGSEEYYIDGKKVGGQPIVFVKEDGQWKASWTASAEYRVRVLKLPN